MKRKKFLNDQEAGFVAEKIIDAFGAGFADLVNQFGGIERQKDLIRFMPVAERCKEAREGKSLSIKETASLLKIPQYRIKTIECGRVTEIESDVLEKYIDFLGLRRWFNQWIRRKTDVHERIQISDDISARIEERKA